MTRINVRSSKSNYYSIVKTPSRKLKVSTQSGIIMARKLSDLMDVDTSNVQDNYVMLYDASTQKYRFYDPDDLLSKSLINGLPEGFTEFLNDTLNPTALINAVNQIYEYISNLTLGKLANVKETVDDASDTFIVRFDESTGKYEAVDPDEILKSAVDENGLPSNFITYLNNILVPLSLLNLSDIISDRIDRLNLGDLANVDDENVLDKYILMYNSAIQRYRTVNPDEVLKAAVEETTQEGLPEEFLQQLDDDLDNRIDFDGGEF